MTPLSTQSHQRIITGTIVSDKMQNTAIIKVVRLKKDQKYKKYFKVSARHVAHNPDNTYHTGDVVNIQETRPLSKTKRWIIIGKAKSA